jgi:hypothetical protein
VQLFDQRLHGQGRPPQLTDYYGFTLGALSQAGWALAAPPSREKDGSMLPAQISFK